MNLSSAISLSYILHALIGLSLAIPEAEFYPFGESAGDVSLPRVLDNSSPAIPLNTAGFPTKPGHVNSFEPYTSYSQSMFEV